jgi:segregation and condensation protein A
MEYKFTTLKFEGPLDLLLHLIKESDIDIFDINIVDITDQYLNYINGMENLNLNVDSEYLVMAAELIEMKSRELLPHDDSNLEEEDPKEELINRLVEYQKYKEVSKTFQDLEGLRKDLFSKEPSLLDEFHDDNVKIGDDVSLDDLVKAFLEFQKRKDFERPLNTVVTRKEYSVHLRGEEILNKLKKYKKIKFEELFEVKTKDYLVVTFLAILDLTKKGKLNISQDRNLGAITLMAKGEV